MPITIGQNTSEPVSQQPQTLREPNRPTHRADDYPIEVIAATLIEFNNDLHQAAAKLRVGKEDLRSRALRKGLIPYRQF